MTEQEFECMVQEYQLLVYTVCKRLVGDAHQAEDLAQETFLSAWLHRDRCPAEAPKAWLCRIAVNKAKDCLKSAYSRRVSAQGQPEDLPQQQAAQPNEQPQQMCEQKEATQQIAASIGALREPYRAVSVLYFLQQRPVCEIAQLLCRPDKTINTQIYRARGLLRASLAG